MEPDQKGCWERLVKKITSHLSKLLSCLYFCHSPTANLMINVQRVESYTLNAVSLMSRVAWSGSPSRLKVCNYPIVFSVSLPVVRQGYFPLAFKEDPGLIYEYSNHKKKT